MKKLIAIIAVLVSLFSLASCDTPSRVVTTYTVDKDGRTVKTVQRFYSDSVNRTTVVYNNPGLWWNYQPYYRPYYYYTPRYYYHPYNYYPRRK